MPFPESNDPVPAPAGITQPCSEACVCFQRLSGGGWSDFGLCTNPASPFHGSPVRLGHECGHYQPAGGVPYPRQD